MEQNLGFAGGLGKSFLGLRVEGFRSLRWELVNFYRVALLRTPIVSVFASLCGFVKVEGPDSLGDCKERIGVPVKDDRGINFRNFLTSLEP